VKCRLPRYSSSTCMSPHFKLNQDTLDFNVFEHLRHQSVLSSASFKKKKTTQARFPYVTKKISSATFVNCRLPRYSSSTCMSPHFKLNQDTLDFNVFEHLCHQSVLSSASFLNIKKTTRARFPFVRNYFEEEKRSTRELSFTKMRLS